MRNIQIVLDYFKDLSYGEIHLDRCAIKDIPLPVGVLIGVMQYIMDHRITITADGCKIVALRFYDNPFTYHREEK